jgi:hypothetical protein
MFTKEIMSVLNMVVHIVKLVSRIPPHHDTEYLRAIIPPLPSFIEANARAGAGVGLKKAEPSMQIALLLDGLSTQTHAASMFAPSRRCICLFTLF